MSRNTRSSTKNGSRDASYDPHINPERWVSRWEGGTLDSDEDRRNAALAIRRSGFEMASKRYSDFVKEHLGEED